MISKKTIKKISIIIGSILIILYFGGNLALYFYIKKYVVTPEIEKLIDYTPEKLKLKEADIESDSLYLMGLKLKFPFYKEDISHIFSLSFFNHELNPFTIKMKNKNNVWFINFDTFPNNLENLEEPLFSKALTEISFKDTSTFGLIKAAHYSRLKDFSWWNLPHNIGLSSLLILKAISVTAYGNFKVYDLETPHLKGFLTEGKINVRKKSRIDLNFAWKDKKYSIAFIGIDENNLSKVRDILTTVQPIDDIEKSYKEMEALYKNKQNSGYPEELILLSMIALKGSTKENLQELLKIIEKKQYESYIIKEIKKEIEFLKREQ